MTDGRFARLERLLLVSGAVMLPAPLLAQTAPANLAPTAPEAASDNGEIIITATRREATLNSVPLSIQALTGRSLAEQGSYDFNSYSRSITGLSALDRGPGQQLITIRGISSDTSATNTDAPESKETTAIYFDDTPVSYNGFNPDLQLVDIDRIEVLKGPQGTLFGAGALAGVIRIIGRKPDLQTIGGHAEGDVSDYTGGGPNYAGNATINLPLATNTAALRVTGYSRHEGGFIDNVGLDKPGGGYQAVKNVNSGNISGVRAQLRAAPGPLDVTFKVIRQETRLRGTQNIDVDQSLGGTPNPDIPAGVVLSDRQQFRRSAEPYRDGVTILNADATLHLGAADLFSSTSFLSRQQNALIDFTNFLPFGSGRLGKSPAEHAAFLDQISRMWARAPSISAEQLGRIRFAVPRALGGRSRRSEGRSLGPEIDVQRHWSAPRKRSFVQALLSWSLAARSVSVENEDRHGLVRKEMIDA